MIKSLEDLVNKAKKIPLEEAFNAHSVAMDLIDSMLRHLAVVAISSYLHAGAKNQKINKIVAQQLPWPTMGSWKNFLQSLASSDKDFFPYSFFDAFLAPLKKKVKNPALSGAYGFATQMIEYGKSGDEKDFDSNREIQCSPLEFFDLMVIYRNNFIGHGTQTMSEPMIKFSSFLKKGAIALCNHLRPLWLRHPVYLAKKNTDSGAVFHRLIPLTSEEGIHEIHCTEESVVDGRLYICFGNRDLKPVSLYPIALWDNDDILFLNGALDYRDIKYIGYVKKGMKTSDKHEKEFCNFILPFMGGTSLQTAALDDAKALAHAMQLMESGWKFPRLTVNMTIGTENEKYKLEKEIGSGGMAVVWQAVALENNKKVAIKFLKNPLNAARFRREARTMKHISKNCNRILKYIDFKFDPHPSRRVAFMVMELLSAKTLDDLIKQPGSFTIDKVLGWMEDTLEGLSAVHKAGVIHRDIKPSNLMFDREERIKLGDFGVAGATDKTEAGLLTTTGLTRDGTAIGTYEFSSPEQLEGGLEFPVGPKSDLFSVGASFYYLLTDEFPYGCGNLAQITKKHLAASEESSEPSDKPTPVSALNDDCPEFLSLIIMGLIDIDPDLRPDSKTILASIQEYRKELKRGSSNVNCNIIGKVSNNDIQFDDLMATWINRYLFIFWPVSLIVEFLISCIVNLKMNLFYEIDPVKYGFNCSHLKQLYPLIDDYVYISWHLMPLVLIVLLHRVVRSIQPRVKNIYEIDNNKKGFHWKNCAAINDKWASFINNKFVWAGILLVSLFQCYTTFDKVANSVNTGVYYWSDWRISYWTFIFKEFLVFINGIGVIFFLLFLFALIHIISHILRGSKLTIDLYHIDKTNGLSSVSGLLFLFAPFFMLLAYLMALSACVNKGLSPMQNIEHWTAMFLSIGFYFLILLWPIMPIHRQIYSLIENESKRLTKRRRIIEAKIRKYLNSPLDFSEEQVTKFTALINLKEQIQQSELRFYKLNSWPIKKMNLWILTIIGLLPAVLASAFFLFDK